MPFAGAGEFTGAFSGQRLLTPSRNLTHQRPFLSHLEVVTNSVSMAQTGPSPVVDARTDVDNNL
jgi:hypothetical protein